MGDIAGYLILGLLAGALSGLIGLGGGFVIVPALVFHFWIFTASGARNNTGVAGSTYRDFRSMDIL